MSTSSAAARATASDTPRMALAPRRDFPSVPSSSISRASMSRCDSAGMPVTASAISPLTLATAVSTPLPPKRSPPSRSSRASWAPVEAPLGTAARPRAPELNSTSTSTGGWPRESVISRATTCSMMLTFHSRCANFDATASQAAERGTAVPRRARQFRERRRGWLAGTADAHAAEQAARGAAAGRAVGAAEQVVHRARDRPDRAIDRPGHAADGAGAGGRGLAGHARHRAHDRGDGGLGTVHGLGGGVHRGPGQVAGRRRQVAGGRGDVAGGAGHGGGAGGVGAAADGRGAGAVGRDVHAGGAPDRAEGAVHGTVHGPGHRSGG